MIIDKQTGGQGPQAVLKSRETDNFERKQCVQIDGTNVSGQNDHNNKDVRVDYHQSSPSIRPIFRQPLRLKFKGIIINRVLTKIIQDKDRGHLKISLNNLKDIRNGVSHLKQLSLDELQRRTMMVLIETTVFVIEQYKEKLIRQAFKALQQFPPS